MDPGLDKAEQLAPGRGWVAADIKGSSNNPLAVGAEAGMKVNNSLAVYGDAWWLPTVGEYGADVGARVRQNLDVYIGGWADTQGEWGANAGVRWKF